MIAQAMSLDHASTSVVWMPHYHDMGLIGGMLQPLYSGAHCVAMAPTTFLKRPLRWLRAIAQWRAVSSGGPDFAYRLCVERIAPEQAAGLDLSSWRVAFNGAEPVRAGTIAAFAERFGPAGFRAHASYPCYGMAEATLLAAGGRAGDGAHVRRISAAALAAGRAEPPAPGDAGTAAVCCGAPPAGARLAVVDPATRQGAPTGSSASSGSPARTSPTAIIARPRRAPRRSAPRSPAPSRTRARGCARAISASCSTAACTSPAG